MFEHLTDRARHLVKLARDEAVLLGHDTTGTGHLLLGLLHQDGDSLAYQALTSLDIELEATRIEVELALGPDAGRIGPPPFTPRAVGIFEQAQAEALRLGTTHICAEHLLLALARDETTVAARLLHAATGDVRRVGQAVQDLMGRDEP